MMIFVVAHLLVKEPLDSIGCPKIEDEPQFTRAELRKAGVNKGGLMSHSGAPQSLYRSECTVRIKKYSKIVQY